MTSIQRMAGIILLGALTSPASAQAPSGNTVPVTVDNFIRAESDMYMGALSKEAGLARFAHKREPAAIENQTVIRMNRDTLYSSALFDLDAGPVTITMPDAGTRFMSLMIVSEDHYVPSVTYDAAPHTFTKEMIGTRYMLAAVRTLVDPADPKDVAQVHALQDAIRSARTAPASSTCPIGIRSARRRCATPSSFWRPRRAASRMRSGRRDRSTRSHLLGAAAGWGGNPDKDATYIAVTPAKNDGTTVYKLNVTAVPVDAFWSVSVYNAEGFFEKNATTRIRSTTSRPGKGRTARSPFSSAAATAKFRTACRS